MNTTTEAANDPINNITPLPTPEPEPETASSEKDSGPPSVVSTMACWVVAVATLFVIIQFIIQLTAGVIVGELMQSFSLSTFGAGMLASGYYYVYIILQAPAGFLIDHYGARRLLAAAAVVCALGALLFASAQEVVWAFMGRLLMGFGASFAFVGAMNLVTRWFPLQWFGIIAAMVETSGMLASLFGGYYLARLVEHVGWRHAYLGAAAILLLQAVLVWAVVRNAPAHAQPTDLNNSQTNIWSDIKQLTQQSTIWLNALYAAAVFAIITVFVALWGIPFMQKLHHLDLSAATLLCNLTFIGVAAGAPLMGWIDARIAGRKRLMVGGPLLSGMILFVLIFSAKISVWIVGLLMILLGIALSSYIICFVIANEVATHSTRGTSIGLTNMFSVASAPILQPFIGLILYLISKHNGHTNFDAYSIVHFQLALSIIPVLSLGASVIALWLPDRRS